MRMLIPIATLMTMLIVSTPISNAIAPQPKANREQIAARERNVLDPVYYHGLMSGLIETRSGLRPGMGSLW